jgi:hypothetical protein
MRFLLKFVKFLANIDQRLGNPWSKGVIWWKVVAVSSVSKCNISMLNMWFQWISKKNLNKSNSYFRSAFSQRVLCFEINLSNLWQFDPAVWRASALKKQVHEYDIIFPLNAFQMRKNSSSSMLRENLKNQSGKIMLHSDYTI